MNIRYARFTTAGVRPGNEDYLDYWESPDPLVREGQGRIGLLADGVGGTEHGELASRLAVEEGIRVFRESSPGDEPAAILRRIFTAACIKVFDTSRKEQAGRSMATTLVASIFRGNTVTVAHVGDTRAYLVRPDSIRRLTVDHAATALPVKLGLMLERQAMTSAERSRLTRSLGGDPFCQPDLSSFILQHGDFVLHCTDGLYAFVLDNEMHDIVIRNHPYDACRKLVSLTEKRASDDNISLQIFEVRDWERIVREQTAAQEKVQAKAKSTTLGGETKKKGATPSPVVVSAGRTGELAPGMMLDDRFELTDLIARSNMASIFKARDRLTDQSVAIKMPLMSMESDIAGFERFRREEEIGLRLNHPYILKIIPVEAEKSRPYIVEEFLEGETLADMLRERKPLPEAEAAKIICRVCEALEYLHKQGIVHRDLKPQNIMLCKDGSIRLMDFGIARLTKARRLTFVGFSPVMGTPDYMSPEQVKGKRGDHRSDLYSLGAILYEMVTGATPFEGESPYVVMNARVTGDPEAPRKLNPDLSAEIEEITLHALERDPAKRYASAEELKRELQDYKAVVLTKRYERLRAPQPWKNRSSMALMIGGLVVLQIIIFLLMLFYFKGPHH
jgi:serine/threonine protein phosphatase PrpC